MPTVYTASEIATWHVSEEYEPGKWRPARPCAIGGFRLTQRIRIAWSVFTGRNDAVNWGATSGEWNNTQIVYRDYTENGFIRSGEQK